MTARILIEEVYKNIWDIVLEEHDKIWTVAEDLSWFEACEKARALQKQIKCWVEIRHFAEEDTE